MTTVVEQTTNVAIYQLMEKMRNVADKENRSTTVAAMLMLAYLMIKGTDIEEDELVDMAQEFSDMMCAWVPGAGEVRH